MASPTQDDSLVFADESRWAHRQFSGRKLPNTLNFSPVSEREYEPTQLDQSTSPVFRDESYSLSDEYEISLSGMGKRSENGFSPEERTNAHSQELLNLANIDGVDMGADTQLIGGVENSEELQRQPHDTQVIISGDYLPTRSIKRTYSTSARESSQEGKIMSDRATIGKSNKEETQVVGVFINNTDIEEQGEDTQRIGGSFTQVIEGGDHLKPNTEGATHDPLPLDDTQVIQRNKALIAYDTQIIPNRSLGEAKNTSHAAGGTQILSNSLHMTSTTLIWKDSQRITDVADLRPEETSITQVESSPNKNFEMETTLLLSPSRPTDEPTTQVLNTQEELVYDKQGSVDLGCQPVYSSGQNEQKLQSDLSIISNDEDLRVGGNEMLYEDSIFRHKRKRIRLESSSQGIENSQDSHEPMNQVDGKNNDNDTASDKKSKKLELPQQENLEMTAGSRSPKPEIDDEADQPTSSALIAHKMAWSQSSSELEDVSHDVQDLDLNALPSVNVDDFEENNGRILLPTKRRRNEISETQTQKKKPQLREEDLRSLGVQSIVNPKAVWAFSLFKHYPARVLESGEVSSYIEFADLAQFELKNTDLFLLDLRLGDVVQVILHSGEYIITGLAEVNPDSDFKCIRGYDTVYVTKKGRHNVAQGKEIQVSIFDLFMEVGQWATHQQKYHIVHEDINLVQENFGVVRKLLWNLKYVENTKSQVSCNQLTKVSPKKLILDNAGKMLKSNLFEGIVFFITSIEGARKDQLSEMITSNGGVFIDDEIKQYTNRETLEDGKLHLSLTKFEGFHFGALLSDGYSRSAKYLQALALGWPILADCFVEQAINNPEMLDNWQVYLLPAGHSLYTNGIRSMEVYDFRSNCSNEITMNGQLGNNLHLLASSNMVILNKKQDGKTLDMCGFIFHAFGAKSLKLLLSVLEINNFLRVHDFKNILVYDNAAKEYTNSHSKKTSRKSQKMKTKCTVGIVDWEWVVQCVISGYVWSPETIVTI